MQLPDLIRQLSGNNNYNTNSIYEAEVVDIDLENRVAIVDTISGPAVSLLKVKLMTTIGDGFLIVPKIGSSVIIMLNPLMDPFIIQYGEVQETIITNSKGITLNSDEYNGLVKVQELTDKLNVLEDAMNNLITKFNSHVHATNGAPIDPSTIDTDVIQKTYIDDLQNQDIKHGPKAE